ncbi:MAG: hypothetical protein KC613_03480, partial [Myxococcales bacterium]|nr:hypothetical protein [Myxococcales bacterium]
MRGAWTAVIALALLGACDDGGEASGPADAGLDLAMLDGALPDGAAPDMARDGANPDGAPPADMTPPADMAPPDMAPPGVFHPGPYGTGWRDVAGPFVVPTTTGTFDYRARYEAEQSSVVVTLVVPGHEYTQALLASPFSALVLNAPRSAHYLFVALQAQDGSVDIAGLMDELQTEADFFLRDLPVEEKQHWFDHIHFATVPAQQVEGWLGDAVRTLQRFHFAVDPQQRLRQVGNTGDPVTGFQPTLAALGWEATYYDYEQGRDASLAAVLAGAEHHAEVAFAREVPEDQPFHVAESRFDVTWPADVGRYDTLVVDLTMHCPGHDDANCGEWDYLAHLRACADVDGEERCDTEIARWITTYAREGRWVTDLTPMIAHLEHLGWPTRFRFHNPGQPNGGTYDLKITFHLLDTGAPDRPTGWQPMFGGGAFTEAYNEGREPLAFNVAEGTTRVELVTLTTGHGFGRDAANCAEFCNH